MKDRVITRDEMLERMESGEVFSLTYCTFSIQKKKGGERVELPEAVLLKPGDLPDEDLPPGRNMTEIESKEYQSKKKPNHAKYFTRNFRMMIDGQPTNVVRKIHIRCIEEFNGCQVII